MGIETLVGSQCSCVRLDLLLAIWVLKRITVFGFRLFVKNLLLAIWVLKRLIV